MILCPPSYSAGIDKNIPTSGKSITEEGMYTPKNQSGFLAGSMFIKKHRPEVKLKDSLVQYIRHFNFGYYPEMFRTLEMFNVNMSKL